METNLLVPHGTYEPDAPIQYTDVLYAVFVRIASGDTIQGAIESVGAFGRTSFYNWRKCYPEWVEWVEQRARADVAERRREKELALVAMTLEAELRIRRALLAEAKAVVQRQIEIATGESADKDATAAARLVHTFLVEGVVYRREGRRPEPEPVYRELPFNPHTQSLVDCEISFPPGSKIQIDTPDVIELTPGD